MLVGTGSFTNVKTHLAKTCGGLPATGATMGHDELSVFHIVAPIVIVSNYGYNYGHNRVLAMGMTTFTTMGIARTVHTCSDGLTMSTSSKDW